MAKASTANKRSRGETELVEPKTKKSKSSRNDQQLSQVEDVPDSEEDPGHSMSVQFLAAAKQSTERSNAVLAKFSKTLDKRKQRLVDLLDERALKLTEENNQLQGSILTILSQNYSTNFEKTTSMPTSVLKHIPSTKPTISTVYNAARSGIALSRELLGHYDRVCQQIASLEGVVRMESGSEGDLQMLQRVINQQGERIKLKVGQLLNGSRKLAKEHPGGDASTGDDDLWSRFAVIEATKEEGKVERNGVEGWAVTAMQMHRGVQRMVKYLPEDSE